MVKGRRQGADVATEVWTGSANIPASRTRAVDGRGGGRLISMCQPAYCPIRQS